jgi:hypothetical protein
LNPLAEKPPDARFYAEHYQKKPLLLKRERRRCGAAR